MARGEIHASGIVDHRTLQRFRKLDEPRHTGIRAREAIADDHRIFGADQKFRGFRKRAGVALRWNNPGELGDAQTFRVGNRIFL